MSTRSLRHRSSRYSSPATFGEKEAASKPTEPALTRNGQQTSLDKWIEPAVRPAVPSFEDTRGLERLGVLENMQPLGTAPSSRLLQKLKLNYVRPSPRATPAQAEEVVTPVADPEKMELASPFEDPEAEILSRLPPGPPRPTDTIIISSPPRGRPPRREIAEMPLAMDVSPSPVKLSLTPSETISPKPASIQEHLRRDRLQTSVDRAVQEAQQKNTPDLVPGLRRLREDAHLMPELWNVLEAVVQKSPNSAQFKTFKRYIKSGVKKYRRSSQLSGSPYQTSQRFNDFVSPDQRDRSPRPGHSHSNSTSLPPVSYPRIALHYNGPPIPPAYGSVEVPISPSTMVRTVEVAEPSEKPSQQATTTSSHKRKRSSSISSLSSLSSVASSSVESEPAPHRLKPSHGRAGRGRSKSAGQRQATSRATAGNRLRSAVSATNSHPQPVAKAPPAEASTTSKLPSKKVKKSQDAEFDIEELSRRKRHLLDDSFHDYNTIPRPESNEREPVHGHPDRPEAKERPPAPVIHPNSLTVSRATLSSPLSTQAPAGSLLPNGTSRKRGYDEIEDEDFDFITPESSSPGPLLVPPPPPGVANAASRGVTPRASARLQPAPKTRKSARVMVSPNKPKNGGITAGISRAGAGRDGRDAAIGTLNGADSGAEDNDEFCASCGGEGKLLCCDGCTNSFHHACLEPPLNPDEEVDGEWFCPRCVARRTKYAPHPSGLLGLVVRRVDDTIPKAFALPRDIRDYFEGVRTGDEGEYEEVGLPRTQNNAVKMNRAGFIEEPNYKETRDSKGNIIRCYRCNLTSNGRDIIPCDYCPAKWHLDCTDPPLAVPPRRRLGDKPGASWRCPLHVEHDLLAVGRQADAAPGDLGRIPRLRKPKNAVPLDVAVTRGFRNNGIIEIDLLPDEPDINKTKEFNMHGKIHRIPELGLRLDFIDRVKKSWYEDQSFPRQMDAAKRLRNRNYRPDGVVLHHPPQQTLVKIRQPEFFTGANALAITETAKANAALRKRSIKEQKAVLDLAEMSQRGIDGYSGDALAELTNSLISEAPPEVLESVERTEVDQLLQLQDLISQRLALLRHPETSTSVSRSSHTDTQPGAQDPNIDPALQAIPVEEIPKAKMVNGDTLNIDTTETAQEHGTANVQTDKHARAESYESPTDEPLMLLPVGAPPPGRGQETQDLPWANAFSPSPNSGDAAALAAYGDANDADNEMETGFSD